MSHNNKVNHKAPAVVVTVNTALSYIGASEIDRNSPHAAQAIHICRIKF